MLCSGGNTVEYLYKIVYYLCNADNGEMFCYIHCQPVITTIHFLSKPKLFLKTLASLSSKSALQYAAWCMIK